MRQQRTAVVHSPGWRSIIRIWTFGRAPLDSKRMRSVWDDAFKNRVAQENAMFAFVDVLVQIAIVRSERLYPFLSRKVIN